MKHIYIALLILIIGAIFNTNGQQNADPAPGVPRELARWRAEHYSNVKYRLDISLTPGASMLKGALVMSVTLDEGVDRIILDWRMSPVKVGQPKSRVWINSLNEKTARAREINEHIIIDGAIKGENVVRLEFESPIATSGSAVTRYLDREDNSEYIYTLFVPSDASTVFPCFDQPDLKGRFTLVAKVPEKWTVVTNTAASQSQNVDVVEAALMPAGSRRNAFRETEPISTYLFAFAAGPFVEIKDESAIVPMSIFVRASKQEKARKEAREVFRLNSECLKFLAMYFDFKFPFSKYDLVIVPEFAYRGMEHAGATFLREESILFPAEPTANDFLSRANVIFHEAAHQWFGDLVTMRWFDDLWLKEGFAEFMAFKAVETIMPEFNAWKAFYERTKPAAYLTDATKGTTPIFQEIPNLSAAKSAYGNIVYRKAPSMLRQAEFYLGANKFQKAIQLFLKEHAYANATWTDLVTDFEKTSGQKLDAWAAAWVKRRGMPEIRVNRSSRATDPVQRVSLTQKDVLGEGGAWPMRISVLFVLENGPPIIRNVSLDGTRKTTEVSISTKGNKLLSVFANYQDYGYGRFLLDEQSRAYALMHLSEEKDDFQRALLWGSLWDSVREAELSPLEYIELAIKNAALESDEVTVQSILNRVSTGFNVYLSDSQRNAVAPRLERVLHDGMMKSEKLGLRITYFRAFQAMAMSESARNDLKKTLKGELIVPGLTLRPRDRFDILAQLLSRGDTEAPALLKAQSEVDTTDDAKRYAFAAGAALGTGRNKMEYFASYQNDSKLAESWIEASLGSFNSLHQSEKTLPFLEQALKELPKLKRTRKIFFVNGWLAAFIGGQNSEPALKIVHEFLKREEKTLDRDLRLKVLEAVDGLERAVKIRAKYALK